MVNMHGGDDDDHYDCMMVMTTKMCLSIYCGPEMMFAHMHLPQVFRRHRLNDRDQVSTRVGYKATLKKMGWIVDGRNAVIAQPADANSEFLDVLGGAHLVEALYECVAEENGQNEQINATLAGGLEYTE
eukprot:9678299-Karenia_brevis.AAC.1